LKPEGTSTDLAVALAIYSTAKGRSGRGRTLAIGEIGLTGDLRTVQNSEKIVREAARMGVKRVILPQKNADRLKTSEIKGIELIGVKHITDAIKAF
jgi:DNA repair protein RadA/Sms